MMMKRSGFGWLELITGIALVALGVWTFAKPGLALTGIAFAYGIVAVMMGVVDIVLYVKEEQYSGFAPILSLLSGVTSVMSGVMLILYPKVGALVLTLLFPIWFIAHCVSRLAHLHYIRFVAGNGMYYLVLTINIIGLILGFMMLLSPLFTLTAIRYFACVYLVLLGVESIIVGVSRMGLRR